MRGSTIERCWCAGDCREALGYLITAYLLFTIRSTRHMGPDKTWTSFRDAAALPRASMMNAIAPRCGRATKVTPLGWQPET
jgi:hypothetical protein